jgi:nucleoside-diphosphate-sugar epimerase
MRTVLITGASGRIGKKVVPLLLSRGCRVRAAVHSTALPEAWAGEVETVRLEEGMTEGMSGVDAIVHLAGIMPPAADDDVFRTNIETTYRILQSAARCSQKPRVVFASSDATYCTGWSLSGYSEPIKEDETELHPTVFYGISKVVGERFCRYFHEICHVPCVCLRFVWTLDPPEILELFTATPYRTFLVEEDAAKWSNPAIIAAPLEQDGTPFTEHICDSRDAADAVLGALSSDTAPGHSINVAGPAAFRYTDVSHHLAKLLNREVATGRCAGIHSYSVSIEKARHLLGFKPRYRVEDSLEEVLATLTSSPASRSELAN